jgi:hypothetical protein
VLSTKIKNAKLKITVAAGMRQYGNPAKKHAVIFSFSIYLLFNSGLRPRFSKLKTQNSKLLPLFSDKKSPPVNRNCRRRLNNGFFHFFRVTSCIYFVFIYFSV